MSDAASRGMAFLPHLVLLLLGALVPLVHADEVVTSPSNNTQALQQPGAFQLSFQDVSFPSPVDLSPLTRQLLSLSQPGGSSPNWGLTGQLTKVDGSNIGSINHADIALISCDTADYPGYLNASATVSNVAFSRQQPIAIVLYSTTSAFCTYVASYQAQTDFPDVWTLTNATVARQIEQQLSSTNQSVQAEVGAAMSATANGGPPADAPNLAAMIILYSITGIITALFLGIIITGAVRAHRHPERYGPRNTIGRLRQSRARGLARAMLDTIPIVKFAGSDAEGPADGLKGDVELTAGTEVAAPGHTQPNTTVPASRDAQTQLSEPTTIAAVDLTEEHPPKPTTTGTTGTTAVDTTAQDSGNYICPICTDDFVKGQDLRVLPCNHMFHPECIDPWLVNVSGTCPLCRIDLNPSLDDGQHDTGDAHEHAEGSSQDNAEIPTSENPVPRGHRRLTALLQDTLNARRMRDATVEERLAALRSVRQAAAASNSTDAAATDGASADRPSRRHRLSVGFRERFRIGTRQHGDVTSSPERTEE